MYELFHYMSKSKKNTDPRRVPHEDSVVRRLRQDPAFAAACLKAAMNEADEPRVLLIALRRIAQARGGISKVARQAGIASE